ncbi:MAG TPA: hypothetical protein VFV93_15070, partial [Thermomicrobiales bacterium]|nr:hypothetical protein [Thermomicrobiales bacterium]
AVAALLFVFLISADVIGNIDTGTGDDDDSAPIAMDAPAPAGAELGATATTSAASVMGAPEDEAADTERSSNAEATPASGGAEAATGPTGESDDASTSENAETMLATETPVPDQFELAQRDDTTVAGYGSANDITSDDSAESNTLYLLELALAITIAWLIVAMIALPRLRRPQG